MSTSLQPVFERLRAVLAPYADRLAVVEDTDTSLYLDTTHTMNNGKPLFFGSASIRARYVSFYLMPVYVHPELLDDISDGLRKRMQGKSCFNFRDIDESLIGELESLAERGWQAYEADGVV